MTVIAFDGTTLAADKRTGFGTAHATSTKIKRIPQGLVGGAGTVAQIFSMFKWIEEGSDPDKFPEKQKDQENSPVILLIKPDKTIWYYDDTPEPFLIEDKFWAIGSGRDFAITAMHLGYSAREAVRTASELCPSCGNGIDTLEFDYEDIPF